MGRRSRRALEARSLADEAAAASRLAALSRWSRVLAARDTHPDPQLAATRGESCRASRAAPRAPLDAPTREASALHTRAQAPSAPRPSRWRRITVRKYAPRHQSVYRPVCSAATQGAMRVSPLDKALEAPHVWARASCSSGPVNRDRLPRGRQTRPELLRVMLALWVVRSPDRCPASPQRQRLRACCQS